MLIMLDNFFCTHIISLTTKIKMRCSNIKILQHAKLLTPPVPPRDHAERREQVDGWFLQEIKESQKKHKWNPTAKHQWQSQWRESPRIDASLAFTMNLSPTQTSPTYSLKIPFLSFFFFSLSLFTSSDIAEVSLET